MANKKYKLTDGNYWATDGVYDFDQTKTQREINSDLNTAINNIMLVSTGDTTDRLADINAALANGKCFLGEGDFYISDTIVLPNKSSIIGCGNNSRIKVISSPINGNAIISLGQENSIANVRLDGSRSPQNATSGGLHGIKFVGTASQGTSAYSMPYHGIISNVIIENCSGSGIYCDDTGNNYLNSIQVSDALIQACSVGININGNSEFHKFINVTAYVCYYGCINNGGNNTFISCDFSGSGEKGFVIDNTDNDKPNIGHGACIGCLFNHIKSNTGDGITLINVTNGFIFADCECFYGNIVINNCTGMKFLGNNASAITITITNGGATLFDDCSFADTPTLSITNNANVILSNCINRTTGKTVAKIGTFTPATAVNQILDSSVLQNGKTVTIFASLKMNTLTADVSIDIATITGVDIPSLPIRTVAWGGQYQYATFFASYCVLNNSDGKLKIIVPADYAGVTTYLNVLITYTVT